MKLFRFFCAILFSATLAAGSHPDCFQTLAPATAAKPNSDEQEKEAVKTQIFTQLEGLVFAAPLLSLQEHGILNEFFATQIGNVRLGGLKGNRGYLRVVLRELASYGWLAENRSGRGRFVNYTITPEGRAAFHGLKEIVPELKKTVAFLPKAIEMPALLFKTKKEDREFAVLVERLREQMARELPAGEVDRRAAVKLRECLNGSLTGPAMVALGRKFFIAQKEGEPLKFCDPAGNSPEYKKAEVKKSVFDLFDSKTRLLDLKNIPGGNSENLKLAFDLMALQGWAERDGNQVRLTPRGVIAASMVTSYMVPVSYNATFEVADTLLFGDPTTLRRYDAQDRELLCDRPMNVDGSGGAHASYFKKIDEVIIQMFNNPDLNAQPKGIGDMGCGNGAFLRHLYEVIKTKTLRGKHLDTHPLMLVGADFNAESLESTQRNLEDAEAEIQIPPGCCRYIRSDINVPSDLARELRDKHGIDMKELLHVRSFLDHNRKFNPPSLFHTEKFKNESTGAFVQMGKEIPLDEMEVNLVKHLREWALYTERYGLLVLELHTLPPEVVARNPGKTLAIPYNMTHGLSDQYLVEFPVWAEAARNADLYPSPASKTHRFPSPKPGKDDLTTVSILHLMYKKREEQKLPTVSLPAHPSIDRAI